jgi:hypothetical protein
LRMPSGRSWARTASACAWPGGLIAAWNERYHERNRPAHARPSPRRGRNESHSGALMPLMPAKRTLRRAGTTLANKHRGRNAGRTSSSRVGRLTDGHVKLFLASMPLDQAQKGRAPT